MRHRLTILGLALLAAACGGGDGGTTPTPTISVSIAGSVSLVQGGTGSTTVSITRGGGYTGSVTLSAEGLPAGVTASFSPSTLSSETTSTLTLTGSGTATVGTGNFTVRAKGTGVTDATASGGVTVTDAPSFDLALSPGTLTIEAGKTGTSVITITRRGGFAGAITLTASGLPSKVDASFDPAAPTGTTSTLTLSVGSEATTGTSTITVTGSATGQASKTASLALTVSPAAVAGFTLALNPTTLSVEQAKSGTSAVAITRTGGFAAAVTLSAEGLPTGVTATFDPAAPTGNTSTLTLAVGAGAAVGNTTITLRGKATGLTDQTATLTLTVTAAQPAPGFTIALNPTTLSVEQAKSGTSAVAITRTGGFAAAVTLSAENLPTGVTAAFDPATPTGNTSTLTLTVGAGAAVGNTTITVRGKATGLTDQTATLALTVTAAPPAAAFTLSVNPTTLAVQAGQSGTSTATIARTGSFTGPVSLAVTGMPANVTATPNPVSVTGTTSTVTIAVGASATPGSYSLTVTGTGTGVTNQTATVGLTINPPASGGNSTWSFANCQNDLTPIWFAFQNGTGSWTQVAGTNGTYSFNITQSIGGVAYVTGNVTDGYGVVTFFGTQAELQGNGTSQCPIPAATKTLNGSVAALALYETAIIGVAGSTGAASQAGLNFQLLRVRTGAADLIAARMLLSLTTGSQTLTKLIIRRGTNYADGSTIPVLDFGAAEAFDPATATLTVSNIGTDQASSLVAYQTGNGTTGVMSVGQTGASQTLYGVPGPKQLADDLHLLTVTGSDLTATSGRYYLTYFRTLADKTVDLGALLNTPTITTLATTPYPRYRAAAAIQSEYGTQFSATFANTTTGANSRSWTITATRGYYGAAASYDLSIADFAGVGGWNDAWALLAGPTRVTITGAGWTGTGAVLEGGVARGAYRLITLP